MTKKLGWEKVEQVAVVPTVVPTAAEIASHFTKCPNGLYSATGMIGCDDASTLMNLDNADVKVMHLADWCKGNDSAKALKICPTKADAVAKDISTTVPAMQHKGQYAWMMDHCMTAEQKVTNGFCKDHEIWKSIMMI